MTGRLCSCVLSVLVLTWALPPLVPAQTQTPAEAVSPDATEEVAVRQAMQQWRDAKVTANLSLLRLLMTSDFFEVNQNGTGRDRSQILALYGSGDLAFESIQLLDVKVEIVGVQARTSGTTVETVKFRGQDVGGRLRFTEVWVKGVGGWQIQSSRLEPIAAPLAAGPLSGTGDPSPSRPNAPLRVGGNILAPTKIRDVRPVYPPDAKAAGIQGLVIVQATVAADGTVKDISVLRSIPALDQAAVDAVGQWLYRPTLYQGSPVDVIMTVTVNFSLP